MSLRRFAHLFCVALMLAFAGSLLAAAPPATNPAAMKLFIERVRPVLEERCVRCHGGEEIKGDLDLTTREGLLHPNDDGPAVIPGDAKKSLMYLVITWAQKPHMPQKAEKLPDAQIADIAAWIDGGAPYDRPLISKSGVPHGHPTVTAADREFWAFRPLAVASPPEVKNAEWCRTAVDRFVVSKLEKKGIEPNAQADRRKLVRRAYFDLIGLPPTPEEVDAFVNDPAGDAYEKLVDRLLANPHYGERWGRHWLDIARFAESHGYEQDYDRPTAYPFRDFVIRALDQDMPFDRFVRLQLAGDELEPANPDALMATGFLAAGTHATQITANQVEKERYDELDDMTGTTGTALLGMTIGCARCHDHKFDPIPQKDYYRILSTFTTTVRSEVEVEQHPERYAKAKAEFDRAHAPLVAALHQYEAEQLPPLVEKWASHATMPEQAPQWVTLEPASMKSAGGATFTRLEDGSILVAGKNAKFDTYTFAAQVRARDVGAVRLEALPDKSMVKGGPGRAANGNFALTDFSVTSRPLDRKGPAVRLKLVHPRATFEQAGLPIAATIDGDAKSAWAIDPQFGKPHAAAFDVEPTLHASGEMELVFTLKFENNTGHNMGRFRLSVGGDGPHELRASAEDPLHDLALAALHKEKARRTPADDDALARWYRRTDPGWRSLNKAVLDDSAREPKREMTKIMIASEGLPALRNHTQGADFFDKSYFLKRGDVNQKDGEATQGFLQVLERAPGGDKHWQVPPPAGWRTSYRRTSLANWITDPDLGAGHLLARVIVNRLWQHHFGRGLVASPNDFGAQGERPTHPELLDYLASELIRNGWHLKPIHRLMMTSAVYMQSSEWDDRRFAVDPENALLWRRPHRRLEAEIIRDNMLAISNTLDATMFGPGTLNEAMTRRSIYFFIKRSQLIPLMLLFDAPNALSGVGDRQATVIAPQALALMNNPHVQGYARAFAARVRADGAGTPPDAVRRAYAVALARPPAEAELADGVAFLAQQADAYRAAGKANAGDLALADFCQALMCLNEFVYVD